MSLPDSPIFSRIIRFFSLLLQSIWLFFPAILFIGLTAWCFWSLDQGKDLVVAFTENQKARLFFFIAIIFWAYVSWYSSRVNAYLKDNKTGGSSRIRSVFPRLLGFGCFLAIEMAALQSPLEKRPVSGSTATWLFLAGLVLFSLLDKIVSNYAGASEKNEKLVRRIFYVLSVGFGLFLILIGVDANLLQNNIGGLFWSAFYLQVLFLLYTNIRRKTIEHEQPMAVQKAAGRRESLYRLVYGPMRFLCIPEAELGYFICFNVLFLLALAVYLFEINKMDFAIHIGPFPSVILAFAVLLGFANILSALSVKSGVNLHFLVFLFAFLIPAPENHWVRTTTLPADAPKGIFHQKQSIEQYFGSWIKDRAKEIDSSGQDQYPVYFVLSNGGASRSAYWTAAVLGRLEDSSLAGGDPFSRHVFCLSGTSGGGVGVASFFALLRNTRGMTDRKPCYEKSAKNFLGRDFLSFTIIKLLGPDYFRYIFHIGSHDDRTGALESSFEEEETMPDSTSCYPLRFGMTMDSAIVQAGQPADLPILCINTTRMQDGNPGVVSNISIKGIAFDGRVDVLNLLDSSQTIRLSTASLLGARFPYISPAGRIDQRISKKASAPGHIIDSCCNTHYFVDGGYFDNSGAGVVQEMITSVTHYIAGAADPQVKASAKKLRFIVLHITNSPMGDPIIAKTSPLTNDLLSPVLTLFGAYDMQTTVNDNRLQNYLTELNHAKDTGAHIATTRYLPISLYKNGNDPRDTFPIENYAMNWFISDTVRHRMEIRLDNQPALKELIAKEKSEPVHSKR